jgi:hypothetical protein
VFKSPWYGVAGSVAAKVDPPAAVLVLVDPTYL